MLLVLATAAGAACRTTKAATPLERPALEVPPPPPRVIVPMPGPETPLPDPVGDIPPNSAPAPPARPRPQRDRGETTKPADPKAETPAIEAPAPASTPPPAPPQQLRMPETANNTQLARQVADTIGRARGILAKTDYRPLSDLRKKAYDDAQLFANQAEDALKAPVPNLVFAKEMADKAERLAKELQNR